MRDIKLPEISDKSIDFFAIGINTAGIILAYKGNEPVGFIGYNDDYAKWVYANDIIINCSYKQDEDLLVLLKNIMSNKLADNFKLLDFK